VVNELLKKVEAFEIVDWYRFLDALCSHALPLVPTLFLNADEQEMKGFVMSSIVIVDKTNH